MQDDTPPSPTRQTPDEPAAPQGGLPAPGVLQAVCWGNILFGAVLLLLPEVTRAGFALLVWGDAAVMEGWEAPVRWYVTLIHGVLGAVMVGWGVALLVALRAPAWRSPFAGWWVVAVSVATWYLIDTAFSLLMGAWQNAVLNTVFLLCFAAPLAAAWRAQAGRPA